MHSESILTPCQKVWYNYSKIISLLIIYHTVHQYSFILQQWWHIYIEGVDLFLILCSPTIITSTSKKMGVSVERFGINSNFHFFIILKLESWITDLNHQPTTTRSWGDRPCMVVRLHKIDFHCFVDHFTICFKHQCNTMHIFEKSSFMYNTAWDMGRFMKSNGIYYHQLLSKVIKVN